MNAPLRNKKNNIAVNRPFREAPIRRPRFVLPALAALGMGAQASALELGDIAVQSSLGEPLRASIAFALNPREEIASYCIYLKPGSPGSGLPSISQASVAVSNGAIHLRGQAAVDDPLLALQLAIDCPYAAHLRRDYVVFVDPRAPVDARVIAETPAVEIAAPRPEVSTSARTVTSRTVVEPAPIAASTSYRVQRGDTLSGIAQRISGRTVRIWDAVDLLFAANPDAFLDSNPNLLKAGALLRIPDTLHLADSGRVGPHPVSNDTSPADAAPETRVVDTTAYNGYRSGASDAGTMRVDEPQVAAAAESPVAAELPSRDQPETNEAPAESEAAAPQPGDVSIGAADGPFVSPVTVDSSPDEGSGFAPAAEVLPDTTIAVPSTAEAPGNARAGSASPGAVSWLLWLGGSGLALILGLLLFGRPLGRRFGRGSELIFDEPQEDRRRSAIPPASELAAEEPAVEVDFRFDDAGSDARIVDLDGDLDAGTGFQESGDIDVAQDFGFSTSGDIRLGLDVEFPDEPAAVLNAGDTDMIPPVRQPQDSILESEVPPSDEETGEYDVSMIVDATKQPIGDDDETAKDLKAIVLDAGETASEKDPHTLSSEVDYRILEQDYQDELTATQALNAELARAAQDLLDDQQDGMDRTARLPRSRPEAAGMDDTDDTVEAPAKSQLEIDESEDTNVKEELKSLPAAENDATAEMELDVEADTKKLKAS